MARFDYILHRADGVTTVELNSQVGTFRAVTSEKLIAVRQDVSSAELTLVSSEAFTVNVGDWIEAKGMRLYCMSTIDRYTCSEDNNREYQLTFYDPIYYLRQAIFYNTSESVSGGVYSYSRVDNSYPSVGTFEDFVKLCCYNCNSVQGVRMFKVGTVSESIATDIRVLTFSDYNCLAVLKQTCEEFETTWRVRINEDPDPDSLFIIDFGVEIEDFPVTLQVEKSQGLMSIEVTASDRDVFTQFVVKGGTDNLPSDYPYPNLQLDEDLSSTPPILANSMIKLPDLYARWGKSVKELVNENIKPSRTGTVTAINENILKFTDSDLIGAEWSPVGGTIHFVSGHLIGFTFNCQGFNSETGEITIESTEENNGFVLPSPADSYYRINKGDKYNIAGVSLPASYVTAAKEELKEWSIAKIDGYWSQPRMQAAVKIDPSIISVEVVPNMGLPIIHEALAINKIIKVQQVVYDLSKDSPYDIESIIISDLKTDDSKADATHRQIATTIHRLEDTKKVTTSIQNSVKNLDTYIDGAFADGLVSEAEAKAIEKYINTVNSTKSDIDAQFTALYANSYLSGDPKTNLNAAKGAIDTATTNLLSSINTAIADGAASAAEKLDVDAKFTAFNSALSTYQTRVEQAQGAIHAAAAKAYTDGQLSDYAAVVTSSLGDLQSQIDGSITTHFFGYVPTTSNAPANAWTTTALKNQHLGDLFYDTETGFCYRYQLSGGVYSWQRITDSDVTKALADAAAAQDTADSKRRVFVATPVTPYDIGDLWLNNQELYKCKVTRATGSYVASDWEKGVKYTDDTVANANLVTAKAYADTKKAEAIAAAEAAAEAEALAAQTAAEAHADGIVTAEEQARIADVNAKLATAKTYAETKASEAQTAAQQYAATAASNAQSAAETYALAKANLAETTAKAYADGIVDAEEARAIADATAKMNEAKAHAETKATEAKNAAEAAAAALDDAMQIGGRNLLKNSFVNGKNITVIPNGVQINAGANSDTYFYLVPAHDLSQYSGRELTLSFWVSGLTTGAFSFAWRNLWAQPWSSVQLQNGLNKLTFTDDSIPSGNILFDDGTRTSQPDAICLTKFKLETGNKATDWTPAPEDVQADIDAAADAVNALDTFVNGAFKDGVFTAAEAKSLSTYINTVNSQKSQIDSSYATIYNNSYLTGTAKTNLASEKTLLNTAFTNLLNSITTAIADGNTSAAEKADVDSKFTAFNYTISTYQTRVEQAQEAINAAMKTAAENASKNYAIAQDLLLKEKTDAYADDVATAAEEAAIRAAQLKVDAAKVLMEAYADGVVSDEEARAIADANEKYAAAMSYADSLAATTDSDSTAKVTAAKNALAAKWGYADWDAMAAATSLPSPMTNSSGLIKATVIDATALAALDAFIEALTVIKLETAVDEDGTKVRIDADAVDGRAGVLLEEATGNRGIKLYYKASNGAPIFYLYSTDTSEFLEFLANRMKFSKGTTRDATIDAATSSLQLRNDTKYAHISPAELRVDDLPDEPVGTGKFWVDTATGIVHWGIVTPPSVTYSFDIDVTYPSGRSDIAASGGTATFTVKLITTTDGTPDAGVLVDLDTGYPSVTSSPTGASFSITRTGTGTYSITAASRGTVEDSGTAAVISVKYTPSGATQQSTSFNVLQQANSKTKTDEDTGITLEISTIYDDSNCLASGDTWTVTASGESGGREEYTYTSGASEWVSLGGTPITASLISITTSGTGLSGSGTGAGASVTWADRETTTGERRSGTITASYSGESVQETVYQQYNAIESVTDKTINWVKLDGVNGNIEVDADAGYTLVTVELGFTNHYTSGSTYSGTIGLGHNLSVSGTGFTKLSNGRVDYTENTAQSTRNGVITITYGDATPVQRTITQAAASATTYQILGEVTYPSGSQIPASGGTATLTVTKQTYINGVHQSASDVLIDCDSGYPDLVSQPTGCDVTITRTTTGTYSVSAESRGTTVNSGIEIEIDLASTVEGSLKTDSVIVIQQANALVSSTGYTITSVTLDGVNDDIDITKSAQTITVLGSGTYTKTYTSGSTEGGTFNLGTGDISVSGTGFSYSNYEISVTANTGLERSCIVTASYSGATSVQRTITQATAIVKPTVGTISAGFTDGTATFVGNISNNGGGTISEYGIEYGESAESLTAHASSNLSGGSFTVDLYFGTVLEDVTYYYRAYATNEAGTSYGAIEDIIIPAT